MEQITEAQIEAAAKELFCSVGYVKSRIKRYGLKRIDMAQLRVCQGIPPKKPSISKVVYETESTGDTVLPCKNDE